MAFNIKNEETIAIARELASQTGESIAAVFDAAVRERAARIDAGRRARAEQALHHANRCAAALAGGVSSADVDELYDDRGMPA